MAVEIPVYINIDKAFQEAANSVPKEMPKLEKAINKNVLSIPVYWTGRGYGNIQEVLTSTTISSKELKQVLKDVEYQFNRLSEKEAKSNRTSAAVKNLAKAYALVEQRMTGAYNASTAGAMMVENAINKVKYKINDLKTALSTTSAGSAAFDKINYQLRIQEERLKQLNTQLRAYKISSSEANTALATQGRLLSQVSGLASTYVSIFGLFRFAKQIRDVTAELEYQRVALGHLIQDEEYGARLFEQIKALAVQSPFRIKELVTYTKQLAAYRIAQEDLFDTTKRLADISAGLGVDMNRLILAYGQVRAASVLRGQELRQFTEAGIPLVDLLADKFRELGQEGITTADVFKKISQRAVPFSMIADIFEDLTEKGGMFYEMQEEQAKTLKGRWEKLKDAFDIALQSIGETKTFETYNNIILKTLTSLANNIRIVPKLIEGMTVAWAAYSVAVTLANIGTKKAISYEVAAAASRRAEEASIGKLTIKIFGEAKAREYLTRAYAKQATASTLLGKSLGKLWAAMLTNPIAAVVAGIAALAVTLFSFRKRADEASSSLDYLDKSLESLSKAKKEFEKSEKLIDRFETLANKTERTGKENQKLYQTMEKLRDIFPDISLGVDNENSSLEEQIALLKQTREEREKQARFEAEGTYETAKKDLEDALSLQKELEHKYQQAFDSQQAYEEMGNKTLEKRWRKQTEKRKEELDAIREKIQKLYTSLEKLEGYLFPEKADEKLAEWQKQVIRIQKEKLKAGDTPVFTAEEIENMESVYDFFGKLKKRATDLEESIKGMKEAFNKMTEGDAKTALGLDIEDQEKTLAVVEALKSFFGFIFSKNSGTQTDPFVVRMKDRIKFMQDFKKGYEDLQKFMGSTKAIEEEGLIMAGRGQSLGLDIAQQKRAAEDLSGWYEEMIELTKKRMQQRGAKGVTVSDLLGLQISDANKQLKDLQALLQSLWDAKTDLDVSEKKKEMEDALKKLEEEIKRSEVARNFYENILDLTGDEDVAASMTMSVYGGVGKDFKERMQEQLNAALGSLDWGAMDDATFGNLSFATITQDFKTLLEYIDLFPEEWQKVIKQMASDNEKNNADWYTDFIKTFQKAKTYEERINTLERQRQQKLDEMRDKAGVTDADREAVKAYYAKEIAGVQLEAMKDTYTWTKAFEDLEGVSDQTLENLIALIDEYVDKYAKDLEPQQLKELSRSRENAKQQLLSRNAYKATGDAVKDLISASKRYTDIQAEGKGETEEGAQAADDLRDAIKRLGDALSNIYSHMDDVVSKTKELMSVFASDEDASYFGEQLDNISKAVQGAGSAAMGMAQILSGAITPQAIMQTVSGLADVVSGIFGGVNAKQVRDANKEFDKQAKLLQKLERSYNQLEQSIGEAFGNESVTRFTEQLQVLQAQYDAYLAQAANREEAAQKESTKKNRQRYAEEAEEAKSQAMDVQNTIANLRYEASSKFAGSDLSAAAESFADAWLSAYQEFGDTSTAIEERMTEMVQNIVKKAALSGIAQSVLGNWYDSLADVTDWNAQTIAEKWKEAMALVNPMVEGMQVFANSMQAEGVSLRNTVGQFTGISRDIAGASEESINGLAAGINTQNFYMSFMPLIHENVAQILTYMTGGNTVTPATETGIEAMPSVQKLVYDHLPNIDANISSVLQLLRSVISVGQTAPRNYVAIK